MKVKSLNPVLFVESIETVLPFWTELLGFEVHAKVLDDDTLGFVLLIRDGVELMIQSHASLADDLPDLSASDRETSVFLYLGVEDLDDWQRRLSDCEVVHPRRSTFYGAEEFAVREPGGNILMLSQRPTLEG